MSPSRCDLTPRIWTHRTHLKQLCWDVGGAGLSLEASHPTAPPAHLLLPLWQAAAHLLQLLTGAHLQLLLTGVGQATVAARCHQQHISGSC